MNDRANKPGETKLRICIYMQVNKPYVTGKWVTSENLRPTRRKKVSTREIKKLYSKNERT